MGSRSSIRIESPQNARIKAVARLREKRGRQQAGYYLIDGARECQRALECHAPVATLILCHELMESGVGTEFQATSAIRQWLESEPDQDTPWDNQSSVWELTREAFEKLTYGERSDGVIAIAKSRQFQLQDLLLPEVPLVVVVEALEKPGNLGAVFRTADATGVSAILIADPKVDPENANVIRASLGTVFSVPYATGTTEEIRAWLSGHQIQVVAAQVQATRDYTEIDYRIPTAVVMGSEAYGLQAHWFDAGSLPVRIPMLGIADSLNVSVSAAVLLYEAIRQRGT